MRYAILSDIHANLPALTAVLTDLAERKVDHIFYLGDAIGYGPHPREVVAKLQQIVSAHPCVIAGVMQTSLIWLTGNHEWYLANRADPEVFAKVVEDARMSIELTHEELSVAAYNHLCNLPSVIDLNLDGLSVTLCHASLSDPVGTYTYITDTIAASTEMQRTPSQICILGHTHYPRVFRETETRIGGHLIWEKIDLWNEDQPVSTYQFADERLVFNPGSVGQPRDGDPRAAYAILDSHERSFSVYRIAYDIEQTQSDLRSWLGSRLPNLDSMQGLAGRLACGL